MPVERLEVEPARLTLWDIEAAWLELIQARAEAEELPAERPVCLTCGGLGTRCPSGPSDAPLEPCRACDGSGRSKSERELAIAACDQAIAEYVQREVAKVDGIRAVVRTLKAAMEAAKQERDYQAKRAQSAEAMITRIKAFAQSAMEASGKKRIEGRTGYLSLKGNGGVQPLEIADPSLIPDDVCVWQLTLSNEDYQQALVYLQAHGWEWENHPDSTVVRALNNMAIRAAMAEPCPVCGPMENQGEAPGGACPACGGSGRNAVPGARLLERGQHVEIR